MQGFDAKIKGISLQEICREVLQISKKGLRDRAKPNSSGGRKDETQFLEPLFEITESKTTLSDRLLAKYWKEWNKDLSRVYLEYSY